MAKKFVAEQFHFGSGYFAVRATVVVAALILMRARSYAIGSRFLAKMLALLSRPRDFFSSAEGARMVGNGPCSYKSEPDDCRADR